MIKASKAAEVADKRSKQIYNEEIEKTELVIDKITQLITLAVDNGNFSIKVFGGCQDPILKLAFNETIKSEILKYFGTRWGYRVEYFENCRFHMSYLRISWPQPWSWSTIFPFSLWCKE